MGNYDKHAAELKIRIEKDIEYWKSYKNNLSSFLKAGKLEQFVVINNKNEAGIKHESKIDVDKRISIVNEIDIVDKIINVLVRLYGG